MYVLHKVGFTRILDLYSVLTGTEVDVMKLDKSQGGVYAFKGTRACYQKADERAKKFVEKLNKEE